MLNGRAHAESPAICLGRLAKRPRGIEGLASGELVSPQEMPGTPFDPIGYDFNLVPPQFKAAKDNSESNAMMATRWYFTSSRRHYLDAILAACPKSSQFARHSSAPNETESTIHPGPKQDRRRFHDCRCGDAWLRSPIRDRGDEVPGKVEDLFRIGNEAAENGLSFPFPKAIPFQFRDLFDELLHSLVTAYGLALDMDARVQCRQRTYHH